MHILPVSDKYTTYKHNIKTTHKTNINFQAGTAVYAGSFDPITKGHLDLIKEASKLFDNLIVLIAKNPNKKGFLPVSKREELIQECIKDMKNVTVDTFEGLTVNYAQAHDADYLLRGMRSVSDFDNEMQISKVNEILAPKLKTVFLFSSSENSSISSSIVRGLLSNGSDEFIRFVPEPVADYLCTLKSKGNV